MRTASLGAKVHMLQVGGTNIIEHFSYNAFNGCKRLKISVLKHKDVFGKCHQVSGDRIYATNENRRFCAANQLFHSFGPKGRKPEKGIMQLKAALNKDRAARLEGSFGNQKNHYGLQKVRARNGPNEKVWVFFGVFTANAVSVSKKKTKKATRMYRCWLPEPSSNNLWDNENLLKSRSGLYYPNFREV